MKKSILTTMLVAAGIFSSCHNQFAGVATQGDTIPMQYASLLTMVRHDNYTEVKIHDPWKPNQDLQTYILVNRKDSAEAQPLPKGTVVYTPLQRSVVFESAHCQLLEYLGAASQIKGVSDPKYILIPDIRKRIADHRIMNMGNGMLLNIEKVIDSHADALLISPYETSNGFANLAGINIPIIQTADYMETSPLGRAEWMRFYGMLYGCERQADSLFHVVDTCYYQYQKLAASMPLGRSILTERITSGTWYTPGGNSTMGILFRDAHGQYAFSNDQHSGSLNLSIEKVIREAGNTDVWAIKYYGDHPMSREELLAESHSYQGLKAFRQGEIYECNTSVVPYFEEISFRPDYLLREMIILMHPESKLGALRYYQKLK